MDPVDIWPLLGLRVRTPRVELRPLDLDLAFAVGDLAAAGIHDPAEMPFLRPWTDVEPPELQRNSVRNVCRRPEWAVRRGEPVEVQRFTMDRAHWETIRRDDIELVGVDDRLLGFLGLGAA